MTEVMDTHSFWWHFRLAHTARKGVHTGFHLWNQCCIFCEAFRNVLTSESWDGHKKCIPERNIKTNSLGRSSNTFYVQGLWTVENHLLWRIIESTGILNLKCSVSSPRCSIGWRKEQPKTTCTNNPITPATWKNFAIFLQLQLVRLQVFFAPCKSWCPHILIVLTEQKPWTVPDKCKKVTF